MLGCSCDDVWLDPRRNPIGSRPENASTRFGGLVGDGLRRLGFACSHVGANSTAFRWTTRRAPLFYRDIVDLSSIPAVSRRFQAAIPD